MQYKKLTNTVKSLKEKLENAGSINNNSNNNNSNNNNTSMSFCNNNSNNAEDRYNKSGRSISPQHFLQPSYLNSNKQGGSGLQICSSINGSFDISINCQNETPSMILTNSVLNSSTTNHSNNDNTQKI